VLSTVRRWRPYDLLMITVQKKLDAGTALKLVVEASVDPRTLQRVYLGEVVRGLPGERARAVLIRHGLTVPQRK
jgi:hypothetical protein